MVLVFAIVIFKISHLAWLIKGVKKRTGTMRFTLGNIDEKNVTTLHLNSVERNQRNLFFIDIFT